MKKPKGTKKKKSKSSDNDPKLSLIVEACRELEKAHGGAEPFISPAPEAAGSNIERLETGILSLDRMIGGGLYKGKLHEFYGGEGSGKTTLALQFTGHQMRTRGSTAIWFDAEDSLELGWARRFGVKVTKPKKGESLSKSVERAVKKGALLICKPTYGEQALDAMKAFAGLLAIQVVDSVPALTPKAVLEGSNEDNFIAVHARMLSQGLSNIVSKNKGPTPSTIIFINQLSTDVGKYGNPDTTPGGRRLKFYSRMRLGVRQVKSKLDERNPQPGHRLAVFSKKNSYFAPYRKAQFNLMYKGHFDLAEQILMLGKEYGILKMKGAWVLYGDERIGQGFSKYKKTLRKNPDLKDELIGKVVACVNEEIAQVLSVDFDED